MKKVIVVSDWAADPLATQVIRSTIEGFVEDPSNTNISFIPSGQSTIQTSFLISQVIETEKKYGRPLDTVVFQDMQFSQSSSPIQFIVARLASGLFVCGANTEYSFTMFKDQIEELFIYRDIDTTGAFPARDTYSRIVAHLMDALEDDLDLEEISTDAIAEFEDVRVAHIDAYGALIITATAEALKGKYEKDDKVKMTIGDKTIEAIYGTSLVPSAYGNTDEPFLAIKPAHAMSFSGIWPGMTVKIH